MIDFNRYTFERDCEQAYYRLVSEKKRALRNQEDGAFSGWANITPYLMNRYWEKSPSDYREYHTILKKWNLKASDELSEYADELIDSRSRRSIEEAEERERKEDAERRKREEEEAAKRRREEEERRRREEEERRRREEEERKRREAIKKQNEKNQQELEKIQAKWKAKQKSSQESQQKSPTKTLMCFSCGKANAKTAKFCTICGTQIQVICPSCGKLIKISSKFCMFCGTQLNQ